MTYWAMNDLRKVDVVMGAVMLIRRNALNGESLFDESFFMYSEEVDLCYRLRKDGWAVRYVPDAQAVHIWGGSSNKVKGETLIRLYRSRVQFFRKHYGVVPAGLYKLLILVNSLTRWVSGTLVSAFSKNASLKEKSQSYGQLLTNIHAF
jgi:GT2 family glycosyltransferase